MHSIRLGLISAGASDSLRDAISDSTRGNLVATVDEHCVDSSSGAIRQLADARPDVILMEVSADPEPVFQSLRTLHRALPDTHLLVVLAQSESHLIIQAMRAGAGEFLEAPVSAADLDEALARNFKDGSAAQPTPAGALYSVISGKLSSGATTVAINVANTIANTTDSSTLLVDLDIPLGDAAAYLNLRPQYTVQDALGATNRLDPTLLENFTVKVKNAPLNVLGGFRDYAARSAVPPSGLDTLFRVSRETFRHTIVDLSGSIDDDQAVVVAKHSRQILIVLTPDLPAIWRTEKLLTFLSHNRAADNVKLVLNRTSRRDDIGERDIERLLSQPVYHSLPNDYGACLKAINAGRPLQQEDSRSLCQAMEQLAIRLAELPSRKDSKGLLGMFLRPSSIGG